MMITEAMQEKLNQQVRLEFNAEHKYLAIAACFDRLGLKVFSQLFVEQAAEEHVHAMKLINYLMRVGAQVELRGTDAPQNEYESAEAMIQAALDSELSVTARINEIAQQSHEERDYATHSFIEWFVDEQVEEVEKMTDLLHMARLAGPERLITLENRIWHMLNNK